MANRFLWIFNALLLIGHLYIQYAFFSPIPLNGKPTMFTIIGDLSANLFLIFVVILLITPLLALIPFKKRAYTEKFTRIIPFVTSIVLLVILVNFGYMVYFIKYNKSEPRPIQRFEDIKVANGVDCEKVHNGKFETEKVIIERFGSKQVQTDKKTGDIKVFFVEWKNSCEYILTSKTDSTIKLKIKITSVDPNNYKCYISSEGHADNFPYYLSVKRID